MSLRTVATLIFWCTFACQQLSAADQVRLSTGEVLSGRVIGEDGATLTLRHAVLGDLTLSKTDASRVVDGVPTLPAPPPAAGAPPAPGDAPRPAPDAASPPECTQPTPPISFWRGWKRRAELGVNGADGNTENLNARGVLTARRITPTMETTASLMYVHASTNGDRTESHGEAAGRNDWIFQDTKWGFFLLGKAEYDEFKDWNWRLSSFAGPSYAFIRTDETLFRGRVGLGAAYEIGGSNEELRPEALLGLDWEHKLNDRCKLVANVDYLPSLSDFPEFRLNARASCDVILDVETKMSLRVGLDNRYDSDPGPDTRENDIEYFVLLGWEF